MKRSFNRTKLAASMAVVLGASGAATTALAVNLSDNGLGEVGLVPYYTVRNNIDTNISVVNTSNEYVVAFKIRFREGDNSRDARDFNVFLSPNDVWTATVTRLPDGDDDPTNDVPVLLTSDTSCTAPILQPVAEAGGRPGITFTAGAYDGSGTTLFPADGGITTIERAQEGHIEIIEMGVADPDDSLLASWAVHGPTQNCAGIQNVYEGVRSVPNSAVCDEEGRGSPVTDNEAFKAEYCEPLNVLKVAANLIRVDAGVAGGMPITTLANFYNPGLVELPNLPAADDLMEQPFSRLPDLNSARPALSAQITEAGPLVAGFLGDTAGADAVSSLFMATDVINEYAIGGAGLAQFAWVVNFPTKHHYVDTFESEEFRPFEQFFQPNGVSCVKVDFVYWDREENFEIPESPDLPPSPLPIVPIPESSICQETQTLNFGDSTLLGSRNNYEVPLIDGFESGWMRLRFDSELGGTIVGTRLDADDFEPVDDALIFNGLPVLGFGIKSLENGVAAENILNYGIISDHAYLRDIDIEIIEP
jgi:hypothetical protein